MAAANSILPGLMRFTLVSQGTIANGEFRNKPTGGFEVQTPCAPRTRNHAARQYGFFNHVLFLAIAGALLVAPAVECLAARKNHQPHAGMLRFPDVSATHITFVYANNLWHVPREGGRATRVAGPSGMELYPRFSQDGQSIAFTGNYDGNRDLYVIPMAGGIAERVTYHPSTEVLCDWTSDGQLIFATNGLAGLRRQQQLFQVSADGGMPKQLPVPYGANGAISSDGKWLAYTPHQRDGRTWKRYRGGMASDIWLFHLQDHTSKRVTDWEGTDSIPMWHGNKLFYVSDDGAGHRLNIWSFDVASGKRKQVTRFKDFDVKWPSIGPGENGMGEIVFQHGPNLKLLNLADGRITEVEITIPGDRPTIRPKMVDVSRSLATMDISPTGKRAAFETRGDIWTVPAKKGTPRNLSRTVDAAERSPSWSPDGQWIAYFCDGSGEYEMYIRQSDGNDEPRQVTNGQGEGYLYSPTWSPDSKHIAYSDKTGALFLHTVEGGETKKIDTEEWATPIRPRWAPDSNWLTYAKTGPNRVSSIWLYKVDEGTLQQVTAGMFNDTWPTFDRAGTYLFFASNRQFTSPTYEDVGTTFIYADTDRLFVVPLKAETGSPFKPESDEEEWDDGSDDDEEGDEKDGDDKDDDADEEDGDDDNKDGDEVDEDGDDEEEVEPVEIEIGDFERRAITIPVERGSFTSLAVNDKGHLLYTRQARRGSTDKPSIKIFDLDNDDREEETVLSGYGSFTMSDDGKKILVAKARSYAIVNSAADQKTDKSTLKLDGMMSRIDPRKEWTQIFREAWRIQRDFFYDPNMHGVDWVAVREQYEPMLADCVTREDVTFVIGEMIAELNVGHAYVRSGPEAESAPTVSVGMLGVDFEQLNGAYRIAHIHEGAPWDYDARGPLSQPNVDVKVGDYLLEVNGVAIDAERAPWAAFQGMAGQVVTLTVSEKAEVDDDARHVIVKTMNNEANLRYRSWVEEKRAYVHDRSDGRVGYIYVPNTGVQGQNELIRQFHGQLDKDALIIDERWNGGGQIPTRFIELLNRPVANYWARRDGRDWTWPPDAHHGPKCMLINGLAGSGGDYFPFYFKDRGLGKLIGTRTWGGLVGISGNPGLIDGGSVTAPTFAFYETDGTWGIEGHGVDPDIEVIDDPAKMVDGSDPQLDAAIDLMIEEVNRNPYVPPKRPPYPNRRGMGIPEQDR